MKGLPVLASPSPSLFGTAPTALPHTAWTSVHSPKTHGLVHLPMLQSPILISSQALKWTLTITTRQKQLLVVRQIIIQRPAFYLGEMFLQLRPFFLLFKEIPSSVCKSCWIWGFFLSKNNEGTRLRSEMMHFHQIIQVNSFSLELFKLAQ